MQKTSCLSSPSHVQESQGSHGVRLRALFNVCWILKKSILTPAKDASAAGQTDEPVSKSEGKQKQKFLLQILYVGLPPEGVAQMLGGSSDLR